MVTNNGVGCIAHSHLHFLLQTFLVLDAKVAELNVRLDAACDIQHHVQLPVLEIRERHSSEMAVSAQFNELYPPTASDPLLAANSFVRTADRLVILWIAFAFRIIWRLRLRLLLLRLLLHHTHHRHGAPWEHRSSHLWRRNWPVRAKPSLF